MATLKSSTCPPGHRATATWPAYYSQNSSSLFLPQGLSPPHCHLFFLFAGNSFPLKTELIKRSLSKWLSLTTFSKIESFPTSLHSLFNVLYFSSVYPLSLYYLLICLLSISSTRKSIGTKTLFSSPLDSKHLE